MPLFPVPPSLGTRFVVAIPARNEAENIVRTLRALAGQTDGAGHSLPASAFEVLLLANNCTDDTARVARDFARAHSHLPLHVAEVSLPPEDAHAGGARRLVMECAAERFCQIDKPCGMVCATDADTRPAPDWLHAIGQEAALGADAVCGRILVERDVHQADPARRFHVQDTVYRLLLAELEGHVDPPPGDPLPRHFQHFGASFAISAQALFAVGGVPNVPALEDMALFLALEREGMRVRHAPGVRVETSARRCGRTALGLSTQLTEWDERGRSGQPLLVDNPACVEGQFTRRRAVRDSVPSALFPAAWEAERRSLPVPAPCEAAHAIAWLRERLRGYLFSQMSNRYVSARKPVTCARASSSARVANAL